MEHQFKPWQPVVVRAKTDGIWEADFFCRYREGIERPYLCISGYDWKYCLPAEGNEHLVGTKDNPTPPEPEFQFGDHVEVRDGDTDEWRPARYLIKDNNILYPHRVFLEDINATTRFKYCRYAKQEG